MVFPIWLWFNRKVVVRCRWCFSAQVLQVWRPRRTAGEQSVFGKCCGHKSIDLSSFSPFKISRLGIYPSLRQSQKCSLQSQTMLKSGCFFPNGHAICVRFASEFKKPLLQAQYFRDVSESRRSSCQWCQKLEGHLLPKSFPNHPRWQYISIYGDSIGKVWSKTIEFTVNPPFFNTQNAICSARLSSLKRLFQSERQWDALAARPVAKFFQENAEVTPGRNYGETMVYWVFYIFLLSFLNISWKKKTCINPLNSGRELCQDRKNGRETLSCGLSVARMMGRTSTGQLPMDST